MKVDQLQDFSPLYFLAKAFYRQYYTSSTADTLTASDANTHKRKIFNIRSLLSNHGSQSGVSGGGNVALASGQYFELGYGFMTGYGGETIQTYNEDGTTSSSNIPGV